MRLRKTLFVLLVLGCLSRAWCASAATPNRPNVLIVLADDQGMGDLSSSGNPVLKTPHLDRLKTQSVRFTDFHVTPMCTPTRGELLTGQDAVRNGATSVTGGRSFIRPGIPTMAELLAAGGYRTGLFGKWHLGDTYPHRPIDRGFQEAVHIHGWGFSSAPEFANTMFDGRYFHNEVEKRFTGFCTDFWFQRAMAWMKERNDAQEPFFCYLPLNAPHFPLDAPKEFLAPYEGLTLDSPPRYRNEGKSVAGFFGMIANIDHNMGKLETFLQQTGLRENTIVIFMTDNGGTAGVKVWNAGLRDGKTTFYDGGHRVPFWVRWPAGKIGAPRDIRATTQVQDVLPTLLEFCGVKQPSRARFDGISLAGLLRKNVPLPERKFVVQYSRAKLVKWESAVVWDQWRLVHGAELYDVEADRAQENNLAQRHPEIVAQLRAHYESWWSSLETLKDEFVPISLGADQQPTVTLTSADWQNVYADNSRHVRNAVGGPRGGQWNVKVERAGEYEIKLLRWPPEVNTPLTAPYDAAGKALPIAGAKLVLGGKQFSAQAGEGATAVTLRAQLPVGVAKLQAWFVDQNGKDLSGSFYAIFRRI